jgi:hypothetical protein
MNFTSLPYLCNLQFVNINTVHQPVHTCEERATLDSRYEGPKIVCDNELND